MNKRTKKYYCNNCGNLENISNLNNDVKSNFFESTVTSYNQSSNVGGWDEI